ncbi:MAG: ABC transporter permease [Candidatus Obscuribacterales bacterium]|nr:ABC transporter permease [Candidatus Obscuribacterales bacterium]
MLLLVFKRALSAIPVLWIVASLTFLMVRIVPGGPFDLDKALPPEVVANIKAKYQLDKPVLEQYGIYMARLCRGDLGVSYKYANRTVNDILADAFPVSMQLGLLGLSLSILVGVPLGTAAALKRGSYLDGICMLIAGLGVSIPGFVVGALLIFVFGIWLKILPVALWESWRHMILPALTLSASPTAYLARLTRASVLDVLDRDYVRTARSKGLSYWQTITAHVLRNALIPVVTVLGPLTAILVTGSFVVEYIYAIPGMGRFFITAVSNRDYDLIIGTTLVFGVLLIITNTIVDIAYMLLDPRMKVEG